MVIKLHSAETEQVEVLVLLEASSTNDYDTFLDQLKVTKDKQNGLWI